MWLVVRFQLVVVLLLFVSVIMDGVEEEII